MSTYNIVCADVLAWAKEYEGEPFHALLCDPSYALSKKKPLDMDAPIEDEIKTVADLLEAYHFLQQWGDTGFMNKVWDDDLAFDPKTWRLLARHLYPGAFLFAFASSRGWHRLACAMEDAGLLIQPSLFIWLNAQAFPKASRLRKAPKLKRQRLYRWLGWLGKLGNWLLRKRGEPPRYYLDFIWEGHRYGGQILKDCASPIICAQKPWTEPRRDCIVETGAGALSVDRARIKMGSDDRIAYIEKRKTFVGMTGKVTKSWKNVSPRFSPEEDIANSKQGRWPANFALVHSPPHLCPSCQGDGCEACDGRGVVGGCERAGVKRVRGDKRDGSITPTPARSWKNQSVEGIARQGYADPDGYERVTDWQCEPECPARKLGEQSGQREVSGTAKLGKVSKAGKAIFGSCDPEYERDVMPNDKGTAARFFQQCGWEHEQAEAACSPDCPVAKLDEQAGETSTTGNRSKRSQQAKVGATNWFVDNHQSKEYPNDSGGASRFYQQSDWSHEIAERLATGDPVRYCPKAAKRERSSGLDGFYWRKDKSSPIGFVRITKDEWEALGEEEQRIKEETGKRVSLRAQGNIHPTVKPISLCRWIATLAFPPKEYAPRRILIPFCGTFSEGVGAMLAGWEEIVGVELYQDHVDIAEARAAFWASQPRQLELA